MEGMSMEEMRSMARELRRVSRARRFLNRDIVAEALVFPRGIHVSIRGGDALSLGAVSVADHDGRITTTQFFGQGDGEISQQWAEALCGGNLLPTVVASGVHFDDLSPQGSGEVLWHSQQLLDEVMDELLSAGQATI